MIGKNNIERKTSIKFLGVMLDEDIFQIDYLRTVKNKIANNFGLLYCISQFLNEDSLEFVYFLYIYSYLNYANYYFGEYVCNKIEKSLFEAKACSKHYI